MTYFNRQRNSVARQLKAMNCPAYVIGLKNETSGRAQHLPPKMMAEILNEIPSLARRNANGEHIWIRPAEPGGLVLLDDVSMDTVAKLREDGLPPACIIETSPSNLQVWIRLTYRPLSPQQVTGAARLFAHRYGGDPASVGYSHFGRLAGFTNRKPKHERNGKYPYVQCRHSGGEQAPAGEILLADTACNLPNLPTKGRIRTTAVGSSLPTRSRKGLESKFREVWEDVNNRTGDSSRADYNACRAALSCGATPEALRDWLLRYSGNLETRKRGHIENYINRTIRNATQA